MTAPVTQRIRCLLGGHDWRRAIAPRQGYYLRCRRCWVHRPVEESGEKAETRWAAAGDPAATKPHRAIV